MKPTLARVVELGAHPAFLAGALVLWWVMGRGGQATMLAMGGSLAAMVVLERLVPALPDWRQSVGEKLALLGVYVLTVVLYGVMLSASAAWLVPLLPTLRVWPMGWPLVAQVLLMFLAADFVYYWIHRAIHRSGTFWRVSGHGFHHAFHNLHAVNVGSNHPFEILYLVLPLVLIGVVCGAPADAVAGAGVLASVNATLAHSNVRMDTPGFNRVITSSNQHRRHHSSVFEDSNTNFACNVILWDRLFGTYGEGAVVQTGIGPRQPSWPRLFLLPFREPGDADTVARRAVTSTAVGESD